MRSRIVIAAIVIGAIAGAAKCSMDHSEREGAPWLAYTLWGAALGLIAGAVIAEVAAPGSE